MVDDREPRGHQQPRSDALQGPRKVQHEGGLRQTAETRRYCKYREPDERRALSSMSIGIGPAASSSAAKLGK